MRFGSSLCIVHEMAVSLVAGRRPRVGAQGTKELHVSKRFEYSSLSISRRQRLQRGKSLQGKRAKKEEENKKDARKNKFGREAQGTEVSRFFLVICLFRCAGSLSLSAGPLERSGKKSVCAKQHFF